MQTAVYGVLAVGVTVVMVYVMMPDSNQTVWGRLFGPAWMVVLPYFLLLLGLVFLLSWRAWRFAGWKKSVHFDTLRKTVRFVGTRPVPHDVTVSLDRVEVLECRVELIWSKGRKNGSVVILTSDDHWFVLAISCGRAVAAMPTSLANLGLRRVSRPELVVRSCIPGF